MLFRSITLWHKGDSAAIGLSYPLICWRNSRWRTWRRDCILRATPPMRGRIVVRPHMTDLGDRIIKVNHAGEHGAICIYTGQIIMARLTARKIIHELMEFRTHEQRHRTRSEEHTSELQSLMRNSYAVFCLKKKKT